MRAIGVSRLADNDQALLVSFDTKPADDQLRAVHDLLRQPAALSASVIAAVQERQRQIDVRGWTHEHDDDHSQASLGVAGACYALQAAVDTGQVQPSWRSRYAEAIKRLWPFDSEDWRPGLPRRSLEKAIALLLAEYDRLTRRLEQ